MVLTPFLRELVKKNEDTFFIEKLFVDEGKDILKQILVDYYATKQQEPFIYFDKNEDKLIILSSLSQDKWREFLFKMSNTE